MGEEDGTVTMVRIARAARPRTTSGTFAVMNAAGDPSEVSNASRLLSGYYAAPSDRRNSNSCNALPRR